MRSLLLSVDGLSENDIPDLLELLPALAHSLNHQAAVLESHAGLTSAPAIWSEILTGEPWFSSGCYGYSRVDGNLNKLSVMREKDLLAHNLLFRNETEESPSLVVNMPLLMPRPERTWLSDGSLPTRTKVSPSQLLSDEEISKYEPRPYLDIGRASGHRVYSSVSAIHNEEIRTAAVTKLLKESKWSRCIWRLSISDQLTHLLGLGWLRSTDLTCSANIRAIFSKIDSVISDLLKTGCRVFLVSAHGQMPCSFRFHLNDFFARANILQYDNPDKNSRQTSLRVSASELIGSRIEAFNLRSSEATINLLASRAVSPVAGCVFVNTKDGDEQRESLCNKVAALMEQQLHQLTRFVKIVRNPVPFEAREVVLPDLIVSLPGTELSDVRDSGTDAPRTTHSATGFICAPKGFSLPSEFTSFRDIHEVLHDF
ncbi:MAG TPA: alkaline phosphatase family protein [Drouetiella sp.]